jgi:hypothetical protein
MEVDRLTTGNLNDDVMRGNSKDRTERIFPF